MLFSVFVKNEKCFGYFDVVSSASKTRSIQFPSRKWSVYIWCNDSSIYTALYCLTECFNAYEVSGRHTHFAIRMGVKGTHGWCSCRWYEHRNTWRILIGRHESQWYAYNRCFEHIGSNTNSPTLRTACVCVCYVGMGHTTVLFTFYAFHANLLTLHKWMWFILSFYTNFLFRSSSEKSWLDLLKWHIY